MVEIQSFTNNTACSCIFRRLSSTEVCFNFFAEFVCALRKESVSECRNVKRTQVSPIFDIDQAVRVYAQYASAPASWQYLRIYSPGGTCSGMLAI